MPAKPPEIKKNTLLDVARQAAGCPILEIDTWDTTTLSVQDRRSIFRFSGTGQDGETARPWSVILKQIRAPEDPDAPDAELSNCYYWEREYLLYKAGIPQALAGELRAPRCYGTLQPAPELRWIWLEDLTDRYNWHWPIAHYAKTAYHLGRFNGGYLAGKPMPGGEYIAKNALRCRSSYYIDEFNRYRAPSVWEHPLIQRAYPRPVIETLDQLAADQERLLNVIENLPQTFCHLDAWHGNMAAVENSDRSVSTVLFDWALVGYGAPGGEIANLVWTAFLEFKVGIQDAARLEREVFESYLLGLADSGWQPDPHFIRCAYLINSLLTFGFALEAVDHALDEDAYEETEQLYGQPIEQLVTQGAQVTYLLLARADELRSLLDTLSL
jgi:hypothetical protein